jgi:hypothetical protein
MHRCRLLDYLYRVLDWHDYRRCACLHVWELQSAALRAGL